MRRNREQLAWVVLLASFFVCVGLTVAAPLSIRWFILYSTIGQQVTLEVQRAPLSVTWAGRGQPVSVAEDKDDVPERTIVATNSTSGRLVIHAPETEGSLIATVQIYEETEVVLSSARAPRFPASRLPHKIILEVQAGRVRVSIPGDGTRYTVVEVRAPQGAVTLTEGAYEVKVNGTTMETTVRDGQAIVIGDAGPPALFGPAERAIIGDGQSIDRQSAPRNLIANGDFQAPLEDGWIRGSEQDEEPPGSVNIVTDGGWEAANFYRDGRGHAEVSIRQKINHDVRDFTSLELHLAVKIKGQNVPVCGTLGSECPVMVRIEYKDAHGANREWLQGFYWLPDTGASGEPNPSVCKTCSTRNPHIKVPQDTWYVYLSPNLIPLLSQDGRAPTTIRAVTIYASGHTYHSMVADVELTGQE
jgi:hypothetical protein